MHQKNSELPSFHVSLVVFLHQVLEDVHKGHRLVDNVLSKCLRWGYPPSCTNNQFCNASDISMPFLPLFPWSFWMWCCGLMCPGSCMMPSCELKSPKVHSQQAQAFPAWLHLLAGRSVTALQAILYQDLALQLNNCKSSFYFKKIRKTKQNYNNKKNNPLFSKL